MKNSKHIELQGFLSSNKIGYKKTVKLLVELLDKKIKTDDICLFFNFLKIKENNKSNSINDAIKQVRKKGIEYPIIMDGLMDIVNVRIKKRVFSEFLDKKSKSLSRKNKTKII